jgi:hypothetical protein
MLDADAFIAYIECMQYTIRDIPKRVDEALRQKARTEGKSLNQAAVEALRTGLGLGDEPVIHHDLDFMIGTWVDDPECDKVLEEQRRIEPEMWK